MPQLLRVLSLEDDAKDTELVQEMLEGAGLHCEMTRIETEAAFRSALTQGEVHLILADYTLPSYDGLSALRLAKQTCPEVPFIFVSGTLGEEVAIEALKIGATDYVVKTRLSRLVPSVIRALRETDERAERRLADEKLRRSEAYLAEAQKLSRTGRFGWKASDGTVPGSQETYRIFGFDPGSPVTIERILKHTHPDDRAAHKEILQRAVQAPGEIDFEHRLAMPDGSTKHLRVVGRPASGEHGEVEFVGAGTDITETKKVEEALRRSERYLAEAQRLARSGSWAWNVHTLEVFWSQEMYRIFDYDAQRVRPTMAHFLERVHPEDRASVEERARIESTQNEGADSEG